MRVRGHSDWSEATLHLNPTPSPRDKLLGLNACILTTGPSPPLHRTQACKSGCQSRGIHLCFPIGHSPVSSSFFLRMVGSTSWISKFPSGLSTIGLSTNTFKYLYRCNTQAGYFLLPRSVFTQRQVRSHPSGHTAGSGGEGLSIIPQSCYPKAL